jgi:hypothetical protein
MQSPPRESFGAQNAKISRSATLLRIQPLGDTRFPAWSRNVLAVCGFSPLKRAAKTITPHKALLEEVRYNHIHK